MEKPRKSRGFVLADSAAVGHIDRRRRVAFGVCKQSRAALRADLRPAVRTVSESSVPVDQAADAVELAEPTSASIVSAHGR
jgi:hypothetical protein